MLPGKIREALWSLEDPRFIIMNSNCFFKDGEGREWSWLESFKWLNRGKSIKKNQRFGFKPINYLGLLIHKKMVISLPTSRIIVYLKLDEGLENASTTVESGLHMNDGSDNHQYCSHCCPVISVRTTFCYVYSFLFVSIEHLNSATSGKQEYKQLNRY